MIVVDASVAVKWFLPEPGSSAARDLLFSADKLIAPALIRVEVAAAITRKVRLAEISAAEAEAACALWMDALSKGVITLSPDGEDLMAAVALALRLRHPLQDCLYLAAAQRREGFVITADPKFAERAMQLSMDVRLLTA